MRKAKSVIARAKIIRPLLLDDEEEAAGDNNVCCASIMTSSDVNCCLGG